MRRIAAPFLALAILAPALAPTIAQAAESKTVALIGPDRSSRGSITVAAAPKGVLLHVEATGLTPGWHGIHFHAKADCGDAAFKNSGGHVHGGPNPPVHGLLNPARDDSGDLTNIHAGADGVAKAEIFSSLVTLSPGGSVPALLDADGSAIVIHAKADDYTTQPIGGAGDRVACGVVK
ncbi:superoxide dismutase family protein [Sphingomonas naphthae]|uniref:Superoxide dismutase [Cu-Zn] n=1 Tax=Sphingomonas naphthae TaxID=1813468 RepID=A0ABY7TI10_9SPHN|nr:superoxide dismutase family protein [Sphingomonas naphthae]WCT72856.1 superoxide dismutase family protein [Sphingomonas naphthae]